MAKNLSTSVLSRSSKLMAVAARVGTSEITRRIAPWSSARERARQAKLIAEALSQLKGAVMKAGQLLSLQTEDLLPDEVTKVLSRLHSDAEPIDFERMRAVVEAELGPQYESLTNLNATPLAAASIGQVHLGQVDDTKVAIKIQYPGVAESIDSDIAALRKLVGALLGLSGRSINMEMVFDEFKEVLYRETDYRIERESMETYRAMLAHDDRFVVPRAFESLSTERVLTMTYERGVSLFEYLETKPSIRERERLAVALLDLYCIELFEEGLVQTDPNPGNFLVRDDGRLVLLDFGAALPYDAAFRKNYVELLRTLNSRDRDRIIEAGLANQFIDARESQETKDHFADLLLLALEPFQAELQPFDFTDADYAKRSRQIGADFSRSLRYSPPPKQLLFLHRKLGGLFNIIKRMEVKMDLSPYWDRFVG